MSTNDDAPMFSDAHSGGVCLEVEPVAGWPSACWTITSSTDFSLIARAARVGSSTRGEFFSRSGSW